jgi:hypothetical protein
MKRASSVDGATVWLESTVERQSSQAGKQREDRMTLLTRAPGSAALRIQASGKAYRVPRGSAWLEFTRRRM